MRFQPTMVAIVAVMGVGGCSFDSMGYGQTSGSLGETQAEESGQGPMLSTTAQTTGSASASDEGASLTQGHDGGEMSTTGDETGALPSLDDTDVLVRYYLDEAHDGQSPTRALDAIHPPLDLGHSWSEELSYIQHHGNRGLGWEQARADGGPSALVTGIKVRTTLGQQTAATFEIVADIRGVADEGISRIVSIEHDQNDVRLGLLAPTSQRLEFRWRNNDLAAIWAIDLPGTGRTVFHVVLETSADHDDRVRLYVGGERQDATHPNKWPGHDQTINFDSDSMLVLGNREPDRGERSFQGVLYYAAIYATAFTEERVEQHVAVLAENDDTPPR